MSYKHSEIETSIKQCEDDGFRFGLLYRYTEKENSKHKYLKITVNKINNLTKEEAQLSFFKRVLFGISEAMRVEHEYYNGGVRSLPEHCLIGGRCTALEKCFEKKYLRLAPVDYASS